MGRGTKHTIIKNQQLTNVGRNSRKKKEIQSNQNAINKVPLLNPYILIITPNEYELNSPIKWIVWLYGKSNKNQFHATYKKVTSDLWIQIGSK